MILLQIEGRCLVSVQKSGSADIIIIRNIKCKCSESKRNSTIEDSLCHGFVINAFATCTYLSDVFWCDGSCLICDYIHPVIFRFIYIQSIYGIGGIIRIRKDRDVAICICVT